MTIKAFAIASAAVLMMSATGAQAANLLTNGDFATGDLTGWTVVGTVQDTQPDRVVVYGNPGNIYGESVGQDPFSATTHAAYFSSDVPSKGGQAIKQDFTVTAAGKYVISFDYYIPTNGINNPYDAFLTVSDAAGNLVTYDAKLTGNHGWNQFSTVETLGTGLNDLSFNLTVPSNYSRDKSFQYAADFLMTNASVVSSVPEPATWAIMILGFMGMGAVLRQRRGRGMLAA